MKVTFILHGYIKKPFGTDKIEVDVPEGTTVSEAMDSLGVRIDLVVSIVIDEVTCSPETVLNEGDEVQLLPQISGG